MEGRVSVLRRIEPVTVLRYVFLPGIVPRVRSFARTGFGSLAFLMAYLYACVRLLPPDHPYLRPENAGRFGMRHVIAEAANRLVLKRENTDQIVMFVILLLGFVLLVLQFALLFSGMIFRPAFADPPMPFAGIFVTANPLNDIAFELLDKVFAIPDLYNSQYDPGPAVPPFNAALHQLIEFYNFAILLVGVLIFLYYMIVVVAETAATGTPFGRRFSHIYAPLRLVIAIGLLVPLNYGFNGAQYIALYAAKMGSSVATNVWLTFNDALTDAMGGNSNAAGVPAQTLVARPQFPDLNDLVQFMSLVKACERGYEISYQQPPYGTVNTPERTEIQPYLVWGTADSAPMAGTDYATAIGDTMFNNRDILIRFGHKSQPLYGRYSGYVYPFCGEITVPISDVTQIGARMIQEQYYNIIRDLYNSVALTRFAERATALNLTRDPRSGAPQDVVIPGDNNPNPGMPDEAWRQAQVNQLNERVRVAVLDARDQMIAGTNFAVPVELTNRGWAGAAIWYNRIAMWNGALFGSVFNTPAPAHMPAVMEKVEQERRVHDENVDSTKRYEPYMQEGRPVGLEPGEFGIAKLLNGVYQYWRIDNPGASPDGRNTGNIFMDLMNALFPVNSLFQIRNNVDVHPLAQLVGLGKSIMDTAVRNLVLGLGFGALGGMMEILQPGMGAPLNFFSGMFVMLTTMGLTIGFILYYVLPFLPFIYFFFSVGSWVKAIFEAMVGAPLWALAHLRVDGNGLPGEAAMNGYYMLFEIFLRPVLTLSGLIGGLLIFSALTRVLHDIFPLLISNVAGYDSTLLAAAAPDPAVSFKGSVLDEFFYSILYTVLVYSMGTSCFKLIDQIPDHAIQWLGANIQPFADDRDTIEKFTQYAAYGSYRITNKGVYAFQEGARSVGEVGGAALRSLQNRTNRAVGRQSSGQEG